MSTSETETTDVGAYRRPRDGAAGSGDILAASAADLVPENAANDGAGDCCGNVRGTALLSDLFTLDPAALLGCPNYRPD